MKTTRCAWIWLLLAPVLFAGDEKDEQEKPKWNVDAPGGPSQELALDLDQGTWISVDVSPDGRELVFDLLGDLYLLPIEGGEARSLSSGIAWDMQPRFSPDGTRIAFTSDQGGGDNLWVMQRDGSVRTQVSKDDFRLVNAPCWTSDGEYLAGRKHFTSRRSLGAGEIWLYHRSGGDGLQLTTRPNEQKDVGEPTFSPDGRFLYYSFDATPGATFEYSKDSTAGIYAIDRLDRASGEIARVAGGPGGSCRPTPSPDGKTLAFLRRVDFQTRLFLLDLDSGQARPLPGELERDMQETWAIHGTYPNLAWTPDSRELVLWAGGKLWRVDAASGERREIPFRVQTTRTLSTSLHTPQEAAPDRFHVKLLRWVRVSPGGERVVYQALGHLWVHELRGGAPRRLTQQSEHFEQHPSFSRDGKSVVYTTWSDAELGSIRVVSIDGGASRLVTRAKGHYRDPVFTPDGTRIVFVKAAGGGLFSPLWSQDPGVYWVSSAGGDPALVTREGSDPQFGADSERVYLYRVQEEKERDHRRLVSLELDGSDLRTHCDSENAVEYALSPDGRWLAFSERFRAWVVPFVPTGRSIDLGPKTTSIPLAQVSANAGESLQFAGDSKSLHWSLGPELFSRPLTDAFAFLTGAPEKLPEPPTAGVDISFDADAERPATTLAFVHARIVTMKGDEILEDGALVVEGNRITAIGPASEVRLPGGARVFDLRGATIVPGLIDVHAHGPQARGGVIPQANWSSAANLAFGVTTIHDPSHDTNSIFAASELARAGLVLAPRTFSTGTILYGAAGSFKAEVATLEDARAHLERLKKVGAFSVKSYNQPRRDQRQQVISAARELGMLVVPEGGSTLMHNLTMMVDGHTGIEHSLPVVKIYRDVAALWAASGTGYTPTLVVGYGGLWGENWFYQHLEVWKHERLAHFVPPSVLEPRARRRTLAPESDYNTRVSAGIVKTLVDAGGWAQLGAHGQLAGFGAHWELWQLGWSGLSPHAALRCATLFGAQYIGMEKDLGSLEPGKLADFLVLDADPLADLHNSEKIRWTVLNGRVLDARTLQSVSDEKPLPAPRFWFHDVQAGDPNTSTETLCAGCGPLHE